MSFQFVFYKQFTAFCKSNIRKLSFTSNFNQNSDFQDTSQTYQDNYQGHIITSDFQKFFLAIGSGVLSFFQPWRQDMICTFGETTGPLVLGNLYNKMSKDIEGSKILRDKPRIRSKTIDCDYLRSLPEESLGKQYVSFLDYYKYSPDDRLEVSFIDNPDLAYLMLRYREVHDLTHVILNQPTDMLGEVVVKVVEGIQTGLPMCVTGGFLGSLRLKPKQRQLFMKHHFNYAIKVGFESKTLLFYYFEKNWEKSINDIRTELNIPACPSPNLSEKFLKIHK